MARVYTDLTLKRLFAMAGHYCAYPGCTARTIEVVDGEIQILGEIAHIEGSSDEGPRSNSSLTDKDRDRAENLIVLCGYHHTRVDKYASGFSVSTLKGWKADAEAETIALLARKVPDVSFHELATVCNAVANGAALGLSSPMIPAAPEDKMAANDLTNAVRPLMNIGLGQAPLVQDFIGKQAQIYPNFPEQLLAGFVAEYERLADDGLAGDELFNSLVDFAGSAVGGDPADQGRTLVLRAAALGVICHLFQICDLFEVPV